MSEKAPIGFPPVPHPPTWITEINARTNLSNKKDEVFDQNQNSLSHLPSAPIKPVIPVPVPIDLPDKVYWCFCRVLIFKEQFEAGVLELAGFGGAKAFCLFLSKHIMTESSRPLGQQLQNSILKVNANLISKSSQVPYLSSVAWFEVGPCGPDNVPPAKEEDLVRYHQLVHVLSAALFGPHLHDQVSRHQPQAVSVAETPGGYVQGTPYAQGSSRNVLGMLPKAVLPVRMVPPTASLTNMLPTPVPIHNKTAMLPKPLLPVRIAPPTASLTNMLPTPVPINNKPAADGYSQGRPYAQGSSRNLLGMLPSPVPVRMVPPMASLTNTLPTSVPINKKTASDGYSQGEVCKAKKAIRIVFKTPPVKNQSNPKPKPKLTQEFVVKNQMEINSISQDHQITQYSNTDPCQEALEYQKALEKAAVKGKKIPWKRRSIEVPTNLKEKLNFLISKDSTLKVPPVNELNKSRDNIIEKQINEMQKEVNKKQKLVDKAESQSSESAAEIYKNTFNKTRSRSRSKSRALKSPRPRKHSESPKRPRQRSKSREHRRSESRLKSPARSPKRPANSPARSSKRSPKSPVRSRSKSSARSSKIRSKSPVRSPKGRSKSSVRSHNRRSKSPARSPKRRSKSPVRSPKVRSISPHSRIRKGKTSASSERRTSADTKQMKDTESAVVLKVYKNDKVNVLGNYIYVIMETEKLYDGHYSQFTQIGASVSKNNQQRSFFQPVLPFHMNEYTNNLVLKNMNSLLSSLNYELSEKANVYKFKHVNKGSINPVTEENALKEFLGFLRNLNEDGMEIILFMNSKEAILPLLLSKMAHYQLEAEFNCLVKGFCDLTSCIQNLKLGDIWKTSNALDLNDVYKHITGKQWPKQARHCDTVSLLCGEIVGKMQTDFVGNSRCSTTNFLEMCGKQTSAEFNRSNFSLLSKINCKPNSPGMQIKEIEFCQSDRPAETAIVNLKKFDIIDVDDEDEVEKNEKFQNVKMDETMKIEFPSQPVTGSTKGISKVFNSVGDSFVQVSPTKDATAITTPATQRLKAIEKSNIVRKVLGNVLSVKHRTRYPEQISPSLQVQTKFLPVLPTPVPLSSRKEISAACWDKQYSCEVRKGIELPPVSVSGGPVQKTVSLKIQQNGLPTSWFVGKAGFLSVNPLFKYSQYNATAQITGNPSNKFDFYNIVHKEAWVYTSRESSGKENACVDVIFENITQQRKFLPQLVCPAVIRFINPNSEAASPFPSTPVGDVPIPGITLTSFENPVPPNPSSASPAPMGQNLPTVPNRSDTIPTKERVLPNPLPSKHATHFPTFLPAPVPVIKKSVVPSIESLRLPVPVPTWDNSSSTMIKSPVFAPASPEVSPDLEKISQSQSDNINGKLEWMTVMDKEIAPPKNLTPSKSTSLEELRAMSIKRLKLACEDLGLTKYGNKDDLLERLLNYYAVN